MNKAYPPPSATRGFNPLLYYYLGGLKTIVAVIRESESRKPRG